MTRPLEKDTCRDVIVPALRRAGWADGQIRAEYAVKARKVLSLGGVERELADGRVDYVLEIVPGLPVAVVEAKREHREAREGLHQAIRYGQQLDVPVVYSSNGREIIERDLASGHERVVENFRSPAELWSDYCAWRGVSPDDARLLTQPFNRQKRTASGDVVRLRWYQQVAVHRVLTAYLRGDKRVLLLMATGTGKTFTAMQIVAKLRAYRRLVDEYGTFRVLYLADRDALVQQPIDKDFGTAFGPEPLARVAAGQDGRSRDIVFATYQAMTGTPEVSGVLQTYPRDFFDLVIVDECHRGSAAENSSWRAILDHFAPAVQLGLTATPKQEDTVDTYRYFGDPVFSYSLRQGIEDGYLAPYRVRRVVLSPDSDGWSPEDGEKDVHGQVIEPGTYGTRDFERVVRLRARTRLAVGYLARRLRAERSRMIVFCYDQDHAEEVRRGLVAEFPDWTRGDPEWVVRITSDEEDKKRLIRDLSNPELESPLVATTSRLLATGIDVEDLRFVVVFRPVGSQVEFKQIVGRGTRLYPDKGKTSFEIIDFVGAAQHFSDPTFDGFPVRITDETVSPDEDSPDGVVIDVVTDDGFDGSDGEAGDGESVEEPTPGFAPGNPTDGRGADGGTGGGGEPTPRVRYVVEGGSFDILAESLQVPDVSTGRLVLTDYGQFVAGEVKRLAPAPDVLAQLWTDREKRHDVVASLAASGIDVEALRGTDADGVDVFDLLLNLAWNQPTRTRAERVRQVREQHHAEIEQLAEFARAALEGLLERYEQHGVEDIDSPQVLQLPPLSDLGDRREIMRRLGGGSGWREVIGMVERWIYSTERGA